MLSFLASLHNIVLAGGKEKKKKKVWNTQQAGQQAGGVEIFSLRDRFLQAQGICISQLRATFGGWEKRVS
jgi:hypothetical protein